MFGVEQNEFIVQHSYDGSWRKMWLERPRVRFDGKLVDAVSADCCPVDLSFHNIEIINPTNLLLRDLVGNAGVAHV
jgi:hypothetical protein